MKKSTEYRTRDSNGIKTPNTGFLSIGDYMQFWPESFARSSFAPTSLCGWQTCEGDSMVTVELPQELRRQAYYCVCLETEEEWPVFEPLRG